jgi:hypothetical protein
MEHVQKMREFFVLQAVTEKNLSQFLKIHFHFSRNDLGRRHAEQEKKKAKMRKTVLFSRRKVFQTP